MWVGRRLKRSTVLAAALVLSLAACGVGEFARGPEETPSPSYTAVSASTADRSAPSTPSPGAVLTSRPARTEAVPGLSTVTPTPEISPSPTVPESPDLSSPVGGWIAYESIPDGQLLLAAPDGSRRVVLSEAGEIEGSGLRWSPDGQRLAFGMGDNIGVLSLAGTRLVTLIADRWSGPVWSTDSEAVAYLDSSWMDKRTPGPEVRPFTAALKLYSIRTEMTTTVITYSHDVGSAVGAAEIPELCAQSFPSPVLPVSERLNGRLRLWDIRTSAQIDVLSTTIHCSGMLTDCGTCSYLWLPESAGIVYSRLEWAMPTIDLPENPEGFMGLPQHIWPTSLCVWTARDKRTTVLLQAGMRERFWAQRWLPDGRLEVKVERWEKDEYRWPHWPPPPEQTEHRYFRMGVDGSLTEAGSAGIPWWAGGGLPAALARAELPPGKLLSFDVSPDGGSVAFAWGRNEQGVAQYAAYTWNGTGTPVRLGSGSSPRWQPDPAQGTP
jgi:hypothetical protein